MNWINKTTRVPDTRRKVLTWGHSWWSRGREQTFLGVARCNISRDGAAKFSNEHIGCGLYNTVLWWAEIEGPEETAREGGE